jgi:dTDP-4-amino-4,6-dideoxygalactose transaminase
MPHTTRMEVPLLDLKGQYARLKAEILPVIERVCDEQTFILGPYVKQLEERIAAYSQCRFGVGVSSGTDALLVALMALDVGPGDEVVTSPYTFFATGGTVARLGARPVFIDIDPGTYNLDTAALARFLDDDCQQRGENLCNKATGGRVRALMPVHLFGQCADMTSLLELSRRHGLAVIEDAAQAIGSEEPGGRRAGSLGHIGCFSFYPSKNLGAFGDAGLCTTSDPELDARLRLLRAHGAKPKYHHAVVGGNFRIDELQAAVLCVKLGHLDAWTAARQANAATYDRLFAQAGLGDALRTPVARPGGRHIYNQYVVRVQGRDRLRQALAAAGIGTEVYYPVPLHMQRCFDSLGYRPEDLPESRRAAEETVALPVYPELRPEQLEYVVATIAAFYK